MVWSWVPAAPEMMLARVVLPSPGGPERRTCSRTSSRCWAASTMRVRRSLILSCPWNSLNAGGRRDCS